MVGFRGINLCDGAGDLPITQADHIVIQYRDDGFLRGKGGDGVLLRYGQHGYVDVGGPADVRVARVGREMS